jgi:hypothetical protein
MVTDEEIIKNRVELKTIKTMQKFGISLFWYSWLTWLISTVTFLFIEGWHTLATSPVERGFDIAASVGMLLGFFILIKSMYDLNQMIIKLLEENQNEL